MKAVNLLLENFTYTLNLLVVSSHQFFLDFGLSIPAFLCATEWRINLG